MSTTPDTVRPGTLAEVHVRPDSGRRLLVVRGWAEGEPLHFHSADSVTWSAFMGIPIDRVDSVPFAVIVGAPGAPEDSLGLVIRLAPARYPMERLRVALAMAEPDSAARVRIRSEISRAMQVSRLSHRTPRLWSAPFTKPRSSRLTSRYGTARVFNGKVQSQHLGTDFAGAVGAPVRAANRGVVALVGNFYLAGRVVYLDHGEGLVTAYFHLSQVNVSPGDTVGRGQLIGRVGQSGRVTGPHLHWVARYGGISVDPMSLVRREK